MTLLTYRSWMQPLSILKHKGGVDSAEFSPDGRRMITVSDGTVGVWDAETGQPLTAPTVHDTNVLSAKFSPDGKRMATVTDNKIARIWDAQSGLPLTEPMHHGTRLCSVEFSPDGKRIVTGTSGKTFNVWDAETGQLLLGPEPPPVKLPEKPADATAGKGRGPSAKGGNVYSVNIVGYINSPDGDMFTFSITPWGAHFSPDGKSIVTASVGHSIQVWDAETGQALTEPLKHIAPV